MNQLRRLTPPHLERRDKTNITESVIDHDHCSFYLSKCLLGMCTHVNDSQAEEWENGPFNKPFIYTVTTCRGREGKEAQQFESMADAARAAWDAAVSMEHLCEKPGYRCDPWFPEDWKVGILVRYRVRSGHWVIVRVKHKESE